jgi:hypothetical protein
MVVRMRKAKSTLFFTIFLFLNTITWAQEPRRTLLFIEFEDGSNFERNEEQIILESLQVRLAKTSDSVNYIESREAFPTSLEELETLAILSGADSTLSIVISGNLSDTLVKAQAWDILQQTEFFSLEFGGEIDSRFLRLFGGFWISLERRIQETILPIENEGLLTMATVPEARVFINGEEQEFLTDETGQWQMTLSIPASYELEVRKDGYYPSKTAIFFETNTLTSDLQLNPISDAALKVALDRISFPHLGLQVYPIKDVLSINLGFTSYHAGLQPFGDDEDAELIRGLELLELYLGTSVYLTPRGDFLRLYLSLNFGLRFGTVSALILDYLYPFVIQLGIGVQSDLTEGFSLYFEWLPDLYIALDSLAAVQAFEDDGGNGFYLGEGEVLFGLSHFQIGVRINL